MKELYNTMLQYEETKKKALELYNEGIKKLESTYNPTSNEYKENYTKNESAYRDTMAIARREMTEYATAKIDNIKKAVQEYITEPISKDFESTANLINSGMKFKESELQQLYNRFKDNYISRRLLCKAMDKKDELGDLDRITDTLTEFRTHLQEWIDKPQTADKGSYQYNIWLYEGADTPIGVMSEQLKEFIGKSDF